MRRLSCIFLSLIILLSLSLPTQAQTPPPDKLTPAARRLASSLAPNARLAVIVRLKQQLSPAQVSTHPVQPGGRARAVIAALRAQAAATQAPLLADLGAAQARGDAGRVTPLWIINAVRVEAGPALLRALALRPDVTQIAPDNDPANPIVPVGSPARRAAAGPPEPNLDLVGAPALWAMGVRGQGVTVALLDTGVDATQPDLADRYRGGTNSWYDPYGEFATPTDSAGVLSTGHGTGVAGIVLGDGAGNGTDGRSTGVAPGAQWIAAKIFNSAGGAFLGDVHQAFQWVLDPDGDPATADAPQVVNNSWDFTNPGACDPEFQPDIDALVAAGISVVFAAGNINSGAIPNSSVSPANNLGVISAGAVDNTQGIAYFSALGPKACNPAQIFPSLVAPGVSVVTTGLGASYPTESGTSFSAPHVTGMLALLLSALPGLSPYQQAAALTAAATDLGAPGPDNTFGYGLLHLPASLVALQGLLPKTFLPLYTVPTFPKTYLPFTVNN